MPISLVLSCLPARWKQKSTTPKALRYCKLKERLLDLLCCPCCRSPLAVDSIRKRRGSEILKGSLACTGGCATYAIDGGIPILFRPGYRKSDVGPETCDRAEFARLLLEGKLPPASGVYADSEGPAVSPTEIRRGGQLSSLRSARGRQLPQAKEGEHLLLEVLDPPTCSRILDACTGGGHLLSQLVQQVEPRQTLVAVDIGFESLKYTEGNLRRLGLADRCDLVMGDVRHPPFRDGAFDAITSNAGLDHVEGYGEAMKAVASALSPGGMLVHAGTTHRTVWGFEDLLTPQEQQRVLKHYGIASGRDAMVRAVAETGLNVTSLIDREATWGKWYVLAARKPS